MKKFGLLLTTFMLFLGSVLAQTVTITGKVVDDKGAGIANASVQIKGAKGGTITGKDGSFTIKVPQNAKTLVISSINFASQEIAIAGKTSVNVTLAANDASLDEVIVTGYTKEKKTQFSGAATTLSGKVVENTPQGSFNQALQGRAPGVLVNSGSGQPGASANVIIRGIQTITNAFTQPLYVVDGVPIDANNFASLNPNDFETFNILKDASAAALYGSRGALGVIVITTKQGKSGAPKFNYRSQYGFTQAPNATNFDMMNTKEIFEYEERLQLNAPGWVYSPNNPAVPAGMTPLRKQFLYDSLRGIDIDYTKLMFRQGFSLNQEIDMSGGTATNKYFISAGYFDQKGIELNSRLTRYTLRLNFEQVVGRLTLNFRNQLGYSISNLADGDFRGNSTRNPFQMVWRAKPYENPYDANGNLIFGASSSTNLRQVGNLLEGIQNTTYNRSQIKAVSSLTATFKISDNLSFKNTFGVDAWSNNLVRSIKPNSYAGSIEPNAVPGSGGGSLREANSLSSQFVNTSALNFTKKFGGKHEVDAGAYFETIRYYTRGSGFQLFNLDLRLNETGQNSGLIPNTGSGWTQPASTATSGYGIVSLFGTFRYSYDNKYTLNGSVRNDKTSRILNPDNKSISTWSAGFTWNAKRENFLQGVKWLNDLRVRASYGSSPNIGSLSTATFGIPGGLITVDNFLGPQLPSFGGNTGFIGSTITGLSPTTPGTPNLRMETVQKTNFGIDASMFNNRLRLTVERYINKTVDLFINYTTPLTGGFGTSTSVGLGIPTNAGVMSNKGWEFDLSYEVIRQKNYGLTLGFNHSIQNNLIESLGGVPEYATGTGIIKAGIPYGTHYTQHYLGVNPANGDPIYRTNTGTTNDFGAAGQYHDFGTWVPKHQGGFNLKFNYKRFSVEALFSYQFDVYRYNNVENWITRGTPGYHTAVNASRRLLTEQWQKPGDVKRYQRFQVDRGFNSSDIQDAKFLRFRNLNIGYNIPEIKIGNTKLINGASFYIQIQNLAIWSPWRGIDPEDNNNISLQEFPNPRIITTGLNINF
jgi:TonB-linked SusC/RagA family outer membrane protein